MTTPSKIPSLLPLGNTFRYGIRHRIDREQGEEALVTINGEVSHDLCVDVVEITEKWNQIREVLSGTAT